MCLSLPLRCSRGFGGRRLFLIPLSGSSSLDSVWEALRLLELVPRSAQNRDQLLDDQAQALLWLYICTLESKLEKVGGGSGGGLWDAKTGPGVETSWVAMHMSGALLSLAGEAQLCTGATKSHPDPAGNPVVSLNVRCRCFLPGCRA